MTCKWIMAALIMGLALGATAEDSAAPAEPAKQETSAAEWSKWTVYPDREIKPQFWCIGDPSIIKDGDTYRMYCTGVNPEAGGGTIIVQLVSKDAVTWDYAPAEGSVKGLTLAGRPGEWDAGIETCFIMKQGEEYWLYYVGYPNIKGWNQGETPCELGLAKSKDGVKFERAFDAPIMKATAGWYDADGICSPTIVKEGDVYYMIYAGHCYKNCDKGAGVRLLGATSSDGVTWTKRDAPVLETVPGLAWTKDSVAEAELRKGQDGQFYLFFSGLDYNKEDGGEGFVLGVARSDAPFGPWDINPEPAVKPSGRKEAFDETRIIAPGVLFDGELVRMWYHGFASNNHIWMGYADAPWPLRIR